jgi:hypothetical protein
VDWLSGNPVIGTTRRFGTYLALLVIMVLVTAGCTTAAPPENATPSPVPTAVIPVETPDIITHETLPTPAPSVTLTVKNVTITRPRNVKVYTDMAFPKTTVPAVDAILDPRNATIVNGYLRWESVRTRTNMTEAARIKGIVKGIDTLLDTAYLDEDLVLYYGISGEQPMRIINESRYTEEGYVMASFDPSVIYHTMEKTGRDREGYVSMLVIHTKPGSHLLYVNETTREILLPRGMTGELSAEEKIGRLEFTLESVPRYQDMQMDKVRLLNITLIS